MTYLSCTKTIFTALCAVMVALCPQAGQIVQAQNSPPVARVWTGDVVSDETASTASGTLHPVSITAARNGTFSGKVVLESAGPIKNVRASVGVLSGKGGTIPAQSVQVRYAVGWGETRGWPQMEGGLRGLDILLETPPAQVPADRGPALAPIWITVKVPKNTGAGTYTGELIVQAEGAGQVKVPVNLEVLDWAIPDPQDYRTWVDMIQSPDTLALEYGVPLWSEKHWELIARSFRLISETGSRVVYIPLICRTNFGNEQSMVRWVKKTDDRYEHDFAILDRYLDVVEKNLGKPRLVVFAVWDVCLSQASLTKSIRRDGNVREEREALLGKGPRVTTWDPATGETNMIFLPRYEEAASKALWQPVWTEIRKRLAARGLEKTMMLGMVSDLWPSKEEVTLLNEVSGGLPWVSHAHAGNLSDTGIGKKILYNVADLGYAAHVRNLVFQVNPDKGRLYGWRRSALVAYFPRNGSANGSCLWLRHLPEFNITGDQRGVGRLGADMWYVVRDGKGQRRGAVYHRYPENNWRSLDIDNWLLAPGPEGAVATARYENLREGIQICEARIYLEDALLDAGQRARLGADLAGRCQQVLDEHHRAMWKTVWSNEEDLASAGTVAAGRNPVEGLWKALEASGKKVPGYWDTSGPAMRTTEARKGQEWWFASGWQERNRKLFAMAAEVASELGQK